VEVEGLIGFFVNTLVFRGDLSGNPTFRELLRRTKEVALAAYSHQDLPFEKLVEELHPERNLSYSPLFQILFALQEAPSAPEQYGLLRISWEFVPTGSSKFDISMFVTEAESLTVTVEYSVDLYSREMVLRLLNHFQILLEGVAADPDRQILKLPLLSAAEQQQLLVSWNDTKLDYPVDALMHELVEAQAARTPERIAVVHGERELTYRELNARANCLAHYLRALGVKPDCRVALCVERGLEMVVGLLAVLKAGGAYVPLDPAYPVERLAYMLQDGAPVAVLTDSRVPQAVREQLQGSGLPLIDLQADTGAWANQPASNPERGALEARHLAYVIYTSGSSGKP
jgi:non-ribosomal peptide synthetase component F